MHTTRGQLAVQNLYRHGQILYTFGSELSQNETNPLPSPCGAVCLVMSDRKGRQPRYGDVMAVDIPPDWRDAIRAESTSCMASYVRAVLYKSLRRRGHKVSRPWVHRRDTKAERLRLRARAAEDKCRARKKSGQVGRDRMARVKYWFDGSSLWCDDLSRECAHVYSEGVPGGIHCWSRRHGFPVVLRVLRDAYLKDEKLDEGWLLAVRRYEGEADDTGRTNIF